MRTYLKSLAWHSGFEQYRDDLEIQIDLIGTTSFYIERRPDI